MARADFFFFSSRRRHRRYWRDWSPDVCSSDLALAMGIGTYAGGWRIIKTLGTRIAKLDPPRGFAAQTSTAGILWATAHFGFPVSTTHTVSGSVLGAGALGRKLHAVDRKSVV